MDKNFWREYFSIPNIMGYFRIALAMLYMLLFYRALDGAPYWPVIVTIVISGITDFFDGKIARRFNILQNIFGRYYYKHVFQVFHSCTHGCFLDNKRRLYGGCRNYIN